MEALYKIVGPNGECLNGGHGSWPLPHDGQPGEWWEVSGPIEACRNGLHLVTVAQLPRWLHEGSESVVYQVETDGELLDHGDKMVARKARLLPRSKPVPDFTRAQALLDKRLKRATKLLDATIPSPWRLYLAKIGADKLPAAHPGAAYQARLLAANAAYHVAVDRANAAYTTTIRRGVMP